jgi:hypothetical protein
VTSLDVLLVRDVWGQTEGQLFSDEAEVNACATVPASASMRPASLPHGVCMLAVTGTCRGLAVVDVLGALPRHARYAL